METKDIDIKIVDENNCAINEKELQLLELSDSKNQDENKERGNWSGEMDFFLSCLGYAVGLGNIWRFPYLCYKNGGGVFFIPYFLMLVLVGIPGFLLELSLGQYIGLGCMKVWSYAPFCKGIGVALAFCCVINAIYYNVIIAWGIYYLFASFRIPLPWSYCDDSWATALCLGNVIHETRTYCTDKGYHINETNGCCYSKDVLKVIFNSTLSMKDNIIPSFPSNEYFKYKSVQIGLGSITNIGTPMWQTALCLLLAWIIVFFCLIRGIKTTGKIVYVTAIMPYIILFTFLGFSFSLPGVKNGIHFFLKADFSRLLDAIVWKDAASQIFFSLSLSTGGLMTLASYNKFHTNVVRDAICIAVGNCVTSLLCGFVVFGYLGYMAHELSLTVDDIVDSGTALLFVVFPEAVLKLPFPTIWSILFFLMVITLGLDSEFAIVETIITSFCDVKPKIFRKHYFWTVLVISIVCFLIGIVMTTPGGILVLKIFDDYATSWHTFIISFLEFFSIAYCYGGVRFLKEIKVMTKGKGLFFIKFNWLCFWIIPTWYLLGPLLVLGVLVFNLAKYESSSYGGKDLPLWANALGWCFPITSILMIVSNIFYQFYKSKGHIRERVHQLISPDKEWRPHLHEHYKEIREMFAENKSLFD